MNKIDLLKEFKDMLCHNLLCYSSDYLMNNPKKQYVKDWEETKQKISIIDEIINDEKEREHESEETEEFE